MDLLVGQVLVAQVVSYWVVEWGHYLVLLLMLLFLAYLLYPRLCAYGFEKEGPRLSRKRYFIHVRSVTLKFF